MADARSKLDILYQDVLGDIHDVITKVESLKNEFPIAADAMVDKLNVQAGHYLVAAEKLAGVLKGMSDEIDRSAAQAAAQASTAAQLDIRLAATKAASQAVSQAVGAEVTKVIAQIEAAGRLIKWSFAKVVACMTGAAVLGGLVAVLGVHYLPVGGGKVQALSEADRLAIQNGQMIQSVWNNLSDKERAHIQQLAQQAGQK